MKNNQRSMFMQSFRWFCDNFFLTRTRPLRIKNKALLIILTKPGEHTPKHKKNQCNCCKCYSSSPWLPGISRGKGRKECAKCRVVPTSMGHMNVWWREHTATCSRTLMIKNRVFGFNYCTHYIDYISSLKLIEHKLRN